MYIGITVSVGQSDFVIMNELEGYGTMHAHPITIDVCMGASLLRDQGGWHDQQLTQLVCMGT